MAPSCFFLLVLIALGIVGRDDAHVHISSCTSFQNDGTTAQGTTRPVRDCNGTVVVIVHNASSTIERLELVSLGRVYIFFEGARDFVLDRRDDVPEVEFDLVRLKLSDAAAPTEIPLAPLSLVAAPFPQDLEIGLDGAVTGQ